MLDKISRLGFDKTVELIIRGKSGVVLCCTMNEIMMADEDMRVRQAMMRADLLTPDGMPLVWYQRWKFGKGERVYGPDLLRKFTIYNFQFSKKMLFIGDDKNQKFFEKYGEYFVSPFKNIFSEKDYEEVAKLILKTNPDIVWLGLGASKQVLMADGLKRYGVKKPIITVGAAFDFLSGNKIQAPRWVRRAGLEWLFRLGTEPHRLWRRYWEIMAFICYKLWLNLTWGKVGR